MLFSFFRKTTLQTLGKISTKNDEYTIEGSDKNDILTVFGSVSALKNGVNRFSMGDGNDSLTFIGKMISEKGGANYVDLGDGKNTFTSGALSARESINSILAGNERDVVSTGGLEAIEGNNLISLGDGNNKVTIAGTMSARDAGTNQVLTGSDDDYISVVGSMTSYGDENPAGMINNYINAGDGDNYVRVLSGMRAYDDGVNKINTGTGDDDISVGKMYSEGYNLIYSAGGNNSVSVKGMEAAEGNNEIVTATGNDTVCITGTLTAEDGYRNFIFTDDGNDVVKLCGKVEVGGLDLNMGHGYDELILSASRDTTFTKNYQDWLTAAMDGTDGLFLNVNTIQVDLNCKLKDFSGLDWLSDLAGTQNPFLFLELSIDNYGRNISLSDMFSDESASMFAVLDMSGTCRNTLDVGGSLADNNVLNTHLYIQGDKCDTVKLDDVWADSGNTLEQHGVTYDVYTNNNEYLMVQNEISVLFG